MAIITDAEQHHVEQWSRGIERGRAIIAAQDPLVAAGGLLRRQALGRHGMNILRRRRHMPEQCLARHAVIAVRMIVRHESFVAPKPMHALPRKLYDDLWLPKQLVEPFRR